jgi:hypothetical protein
MSAVFLYQKSQVAGHNEPYTFFTSHCDFREGLTLLAWYHVDVHFAMAAPGLGLWDRSGTGMHTVAIRCAKALAQVLE